MLPDFRVRQRDYLLEISRALTEELDLDRVLDRIVKLAAELLASSAGLIALRESDGWRVAATHGVHDEFMKFLDPLLKDIPDQGDPARIALPEVNRRLQRITHSASMGLLTGVGLPMIARDEVVGVIFVFRSYRGRFSRDDRNMLRAFAAQAAIAVSNARLYSEVADHSRHLDRVVESSADGIFILDPSNRFTRFNRACSKLTEYPATDVVGQEHSEIIRWSSRESGPTLEEAAAGGWPLSASAELYVEGDLLRASGSHISVGITYAPTFSDDGRLLSIVANVRDITRFREAEELKSIFISVISHELRTPVALIKGYVGTLRRDDADWDPEVVRDSLAVIEDEADRLAALIDDLLDASRLQAGALSLNPSDVDLLQLAEKLARRFQTQSDRHTFTVDRPADFPLVYADEERMTQVLTNLLSNAVKYAADGGQVLIRGWQAQNEVVICVSDQGPGIRPADRHRIFDRFYRSEEIAGSTQGAGLGLYLAKAIVEAHGGRIWVDEKVDQGAQICFSLPGGEG
ncbi:MAG: GAF domain-containing protein [Chloroflexi bacterium]|nr:GAF domain-containing protein [Chloroflexota bacterium]